MLRVGSKSDANGGALEKVFSFFLFSERLLCRGLLKNVFSNFITIKM